MRFSLFLLVLITLAACGQAQPSARIGGALVDLAARAKWVDSVYARLNEEERIGQLFMVAAYSGGPQANVAEIEKLIRARQIGGLIFMQGGPVRQALLTNRYQQLAQVPLLLSMDAEWGLGMRLDSVINLPRQMMLGAADDTALAYELGQTIARQCTRLGVHVNFAPVVDVNNNPANPVINARSFGEDKRRVARLAIAYMRGMQDAGVMACAKHFPGHGDVSVDSHLDLPVIKKSRAALDTLELYPFRELVKAGVQSVMVAHLAVPSLEQEAHVPTTLSKNTVTNLLKQELGFQGLVFTDALNMQGVAKYFNAGEADVRAFEAGNDVLLFSQNVPTAIAKIKAAVRSGRVSRQELEVRVKKVLAAKYNAGLQRFKPIATAGITAEINQHTAALNARIADAAITVIQDRNRLLPLRQQEKVLYVSLGAGITENVRRELSSRINDVRFIGVPKGGNHAALQAEITRFRPDKIVYVVQNLSLYPGKNYGLESRYVSQLPVWSKQPSNVIVAVLGNAYATKYVCNAGTLLCGYEDNEWTTTSLLNVLTGSVKAKGSLPVSPECVKRQ